MSISASAPPAAATSASSPPSAASPTGGGLAPANPRFVQWARDNEISRQTAKDILSVITRVKVVILVDDSSSMNSTIVEPAPPGQGRNLFAPTATKTRWDEAQQASFELVKLLTATDYGLDVWFFHRPSVLNVTNPGQLASSFASKASGNTPIIGTLRTMYSHYNSFAANRQPLLLVIVGDGEPSDGSTGDLANTLNSKPNTFHVSFIECNDNEEEMAFMDSLDGKILNFHNSDDYRMERQRVQMTMGAQFKYAYVDYIVMSLLAPFTPGYFLMDQGKAARLSITPLAPMDPAQLDVWTEGLVESMVQRQVVMNGGGGMRGQPTTVMMMPANGNAGGAGASYQAAPGQPGGYYPPGQPVYAQQPPPQACCAIL